ncbi:MAG: hypothetical protein A2514_13025 [Gammaproteobacteria bacterium RIFOXYD12_FULL_61_37]|nr:MAG: hypothetical protein A2514_13025 [Gammaproteobacteria bacterium RIFOXYD12_FULL_61_37]
MEITNYPPVSQNAFKMPWFEIFKLWPSQANDCQTRKSQSILRSHGGISLAFAIFWFMIISGWI